jgi:hypothetical protein
VKELRPNATWDLIKWIVPTAGPVFIASLYAFSQKLRSLSVDWYVFSGLLAASFLLLLIPVCTPLWMRRSAPAAPTATGVREPEPEAKESTDGSSPDVHYWHLVSEREAHGKDVAPLVRLAERRVLITGISLNYIVWHCADELRSALMRRRAVGIVIAGASQQNIEYYARYTRLPATTIPATHKLYDEFFQSLSPEESEYFALYHTDVPLTHSIGLYDDEIYVNLFCINTPSSRCPSFSPPPGSRSHALFVSELKALLRDSTLAHGSGHHRLFGGL